MASLIAHDPDPGGRAQALAEARDAYVWDHTFLDPLPMLHIPRTGKHPGILEFLLGSATELPKAERPDDDMPVKRAEATAPGVAEIDKDEIRERFGPGFLARLDGRAHDLTDPGDYLELIDDLQVPTNLEGSASYEADWDSDAAFAWQRLGGPNPVVIERPDDARWAEVQSRLGLTDAHLATALGDGAPTVDQARKAGRLLVCDYHLLVDPTPLPCGSLDGKRKHLPAPLGVFVWDDARHELRPVAVKLEQDATAPLVVADGSERWQTAKAWFSVADFNHHEMGTHLSLVHFVQEGIAVATHRSLPPQHPVMALLKPHFKYLLYNNFAGRELLVQPGGFVEKILAGELAAGSLEIVKRAYRAFTFDDLHLPTALAKRHVVSRTGLPVFPYRDDGLEIWSAIDTWTRSYVAAWYDSDEAVATDAELQRWCRELTSSDGAHLAGFPEAFDDRSTLADALTRLVFLAGPQHAAVNYPQNRSMLVIPNMPGAAWTSAPTRLVDLLPPDAAAHAQVEAIWLLTCYQYGRLGAYGDALPDARVQQAMLNFQGHLQTLEERFVERDRTERERWPWPYLRPSRIPNSTNI